MKNEAAARPDAADAVGAGGKQTTGIILPPARLVAILVIAHLAVALPLAYFLNVWVDEASTLHTTDHGLRHAFENVFRDEKQAPLYFLLVSLWRSVNDSIFFARLFSVICSVLAIVVFYRTARRFWAGQTAAFVTAFFALHPYLVWASLEIRLYSLVILLSALLVNLFFRGYLGDEGARAEEQSAQSKAGQNKAQIFFVVLSIVGLYTNYYIGFLLVGFFLALIVLRRWRAAKTYFLHMLVAGLAILPLLWTIQQQFAVRAVTFDEEKTVYEGVRILWSHFLVFVLPTELFPTFSETSAFSFVRLWLVRLALAALAVLLVKNGRKYWDAPVVSLAVVCAVSTLFLLGVYLLLGVKYAEIRHSVMVFVPLILLAALLLSKILPKRAWVLLAVLYAVFFGYAVCTLYPGLAKRGDWARVGAYLEKAEAPGQAIVVFRNYDALALRYHYRGVNRILPDEKFFAWEQEGADNSPHAFRRQIEFIISEIPPEVPEIWLVTDETCQHRELAGGCEPLENFVRANYTIESTKDFYLERVRLLRRKPQ